MHDPPQSIEREGRSDMLYFRLVQRLEIVASLQDLFVVLVNELNVYYSRTASITLESKVRPVFCRNFMKFTYIYHVVIICEAVSEYVWQRGYEHEPSILTIGLWNVSIPIRFVRESAYIELLAWANFPFRKLCSIRLTSRPWKTQLTRDNNDWSRI